MPADRGHILVVDDNKLNRMMLARILAEQGHTSAAAENGRQALEMLRAELIEGSPAFDIVLLDILMPEMDGYQTLAEIKNDTILQHIPVIMISALDEMDSVIRCIEMGATDYLPKPFNPALLNARLNASLVQKKLRDLERAYLRQEVMLRQSEKLATLGKFSAGMAHELNNPAAAAQRSAKQLGTALERLHDAYLAIAAAGYSANQLEVFQALEQMVKEQGGRPPDLDALRRSDLEYSLECWLDDHGVENPWEFTSSLANLGSSPAQLDALHQRFENQQLIPLFTWMDAMCTLSVLIEEIAQGTTRISNIVNALKDYTYMDQAPTQAVSVNESLDNTLAVLRSKLGDGIAVRRDYAQDMPRIQAYGSELNQAWTNIIQNAVDALDGQGEIILRTREAEGWVVVEIEDNGPGIPAEIQSKIFDPFFTTKPPGHGTGLGLNITHTIIVQKHGGAISLRSQPGSTCLEVRLPVNG